MKFNYVFGRDVSGEHPGIIVRLEEITPEVARKMLEANVNNRKKKSESIDKDIERGRWRINGATIVFSDDGVLLDGQNRLDAVVKTGIPIVTVVVYGVQAESQVSMDMGVKRQVNDFLTMRGYKEATLVSAVGTAVCRSDILGLSSSFGYRRGSDYTVEDILLFIEKNYESRLAPILNDVDDTARRYRFVWRGTLGALYDAFRRCGGEDDYRFFVDQMLGKRAQCQPVRVLANRLIDNANKKQDRLTQETIAVYFVKVWNAYMCGREINSLKYTLGGAHPETFPDVYGRLDG